MLNKKFTLLNQFVDRKCEVSFYALSDNTISATYIYNSFSYQLDNECISLKDESEDDCVATSIPLVKINSVSNLNNDFFDVYTDVVIFRTNDYIVNVCTLERKFIYPRCFKCGKEILVPDETIWRINGNANYGSYYDDPEENSILNSLDFCDSCVAEFVGNLDEVGE